MSIVIAVFFALLCFSGKVKVFHWSVATSDWGGGAVPSCIPHPSREVSYGWRHRFCLDSM